MTTGLNQKEEVYHFLLRAIVLFIKKRSILDLCCVTVFFTKDKDDQICLYALMHVPSLPVCTESVCLHVYMMGITELWEKSMEKEDSETLSRRSTE